MHFLNSLTNICSMNHSYWSNIGQTIKTLWGGLQITFKHILQARTSQKPVAVCNTDYFKQDKGLVTVQYPHESFPIPDNGRYRLHNEIDDCIVCDKCAKICPVDCIDIDPIRAVGEIGKTSDGTSKRIYAAKFDIDMGKCCFCGLCTTVCPTECLTMTKTYDFSEYDVDDHTYSFATMTPLEILEKRKELEEFENQKAAAKEQAAPAATETAEKKPAAKPKMGGAKPVFKPKIKKTGENPSEPKGDTDTEPGAKPKPKIRPKPVMKPKPVIKKKDKGEGSDG